MTFDCIERHDWGWGGLGYGDLIQWHSGVYPCKLFPKKDPEVVVDYSFCSCQISESIVSPALVSFCPSLEDLRSRFILSNITRDN